MAKFLPGLFGPLNSLRKDLRARLLRDNRWADDWYRREFFRAAFYALHFNGIAGDYAEFGCHDAKTFRMAYRWSRAHRRMPKRMLWAFDSFQGLPPAETGKDDHPAWVAGAMATDEARFHRLCQGAGMRQGSDYRTVPGFYSDTLRPGALPADALPREIALAYIDCDLHSSTRDVLNYLRPHLRHGMVVAFDDWHCIAAGAISGERAAFLEFLETEDRFHFLPFRGIDWYGMSFVVEDRRLLPGRATEMIGYRT
ncbi:MAG: hypothetical protein IT557_04820 [Alphaproteobacteria bacterium]|nr:hypothetical protein [Alphaproteobacteria bacterium]